MVGNNLKPVSWVFNFGGIYFFKLILEAKTLDVIPSTFTYAIVGKRLEVKCIVEDTESSPNVFFGRDDNTEIKPEDFSGRLEIETESGIFSIIDSVNSDETWF